MATRKSGNPPGRPKKKKLPRGRPKGQEAIMKEYRMRMLQSPQSPKVLESVFEVALDPDHKHWAAASKMVVDRIMPLGGFDAQNKDGSKVEINITGLATSVTTSANKEEAVEAEFKEVKGDE